MKIEIIDNNDNKAKIFTYNEIIKEGGIYQEINSDNDFLIIIDNIVLWSDGEDVEKAEACWKKEKFVKANKVIKLSNDEV